MIHGLKVRLPGARVAEMAAERANHHRGKARKYTEVIALLASASDGHEPSDNPMPRRDASAKVREHSGKAEFFDYLATYCEKSETYELTQDELGTLLGTLRD